MAGDSNAGGLTGFDGPVQRLLAQLFLPFHGHVPLGRRREGSVDHEQGVHGCAVLCGDVDPVVDGFPARLAPVGRYQYAFVTRHAADHGGRVRQCADGSVFESGTAAPPLARTVAF